MPTVLKSESLNLLESSRPVHSCTWVPVPLALPFSKNTRNNASYELCVTSASLLSLFRNHKERASHCYYPVCVRSVIQLRHSVKLKILLYVFFWLDVKYILYIQPLKMELIEGSETSANHNRTPGKYPKEYIQDSKHGESLKSRKYKLILHFYTWFA